ncbi:probable membrane-associated kinase regulator 2 [Rutidosis leptorrhynchoides]|uniref:probable membrane-associated kinase regulator 2 n=1 Tax=Rutidosis leptorrhynchoides TaxID=125765 RepID=UPI003A98D6AC
MDAFSLLRYWRSNNGGANDVTTTTANVRTSTIVTQTSDSDDKSADDNDHGPFFDLEFSLPNNEENNENGNGVVYAVEDEDETDGSDDDDDVEDESELKLTLLSGSSGGDDSSSNTNTAADVNVSASPSDDLFFKGDFIPDSNINQTTSLGTNSKPFQSRVSLAKHATKFRVMMLKLKNSKSNQTTEEEEEHKKKEDKDVQNVDSGSGEPVTTTVKFKVAEVPIVSLFKRDNSSKKAQKKRQNDDVSVTNSNSSDEKKFSKEAVQKYLRKVKPLYVRVSKKYGDKLKSPSLESELRRHLTVTESRKRSPSEESNLEGSEPPLLSSNGKGLIQGNLPAGLRVVCKHLGKSRSGSTAVVAAAPAKITSKRRDDSLLQQQDGIQSAILHCKRSFKASRDSDCSSSLSSESVPTNGKSVAEDKEEMSKR